MSFLNLDDSSNLAPDHFQISSNENDVSHWSGSSIQLKCPLCCVSRKHFYCRDCLRTGDFVHSMELGQQASGERFSDKQNRLNELKIIHRSLDHRCQVHLRRRIIAENLKTAIIRKRENVNAVEKLLATEQRTVRSLIEYSRSLIATNGETMRKIPQYEATVRKMGRHIQETIDDNKLFTDRDRLYDKLQQEINGNIQKLIKYIFPIKKSISKSDCLTVDSFGTRCAAVTPPTIIPNTITELADATHTAYVKGQWVLQDSGHELRYTIVAPSLPSNGDYSTYTDWMAMNKGKTSIGKDCIELPSHNPAYKISAALTYTTQLVQLLSYYLDIRLPFKIYYGDFCTKELSDHSFTRKVARLNANVLYLCYMQRISQQMNWANTLGNIEKLIELNGSNLGRNGPTNVTVGIYDENELRKLQTDCMVGDETDSEDENSFPNEWEAISALDTQINPPPSVPIHSIPISAQQTTSMAGGLMTSAVASVTSIFRGWMNR